MNKKLLILLIAVFLVAGFTANIMAFEEESLRSINSFNLYDFDVYDDVIDLGDLAKVDGHNVFTNLHNSAGADNFQLGYAGKIFKEGNPFQTGTISVLFNRTKDEWESVDKWTETWFNTGYDGVGNPVSLEKEVEQNSDSWLDAEESSDMRIAYGVELGTIRLGLGFEMNASDEKQKNTDKEIINDTNLLTGTPIDYEFESDDWSREDSANENRILIGTEFELPVVTIEADLGYMWGESDTGLYNYDYVWHYLNSVTGLSENYTETTSGIDNGPAGNYDVSGLGFYLAATRDINAKFKVKGFGSFYTEASDINNKTWVEGGTWDQTTPLGNLGTFDTIETEIWDETHTYSGTVDEDQGYELGLKAYYVFDDNVSFAFGFSYDSYESDTDTPYTVDLAGYLYTYDSNGDGDLDDYDPLNNIEDYTETATGNYRMRYREKTESNSYSIPLAVEFKATEKLTFRAGVEHTIYEGKTVESTKYVAGSEQITMTETSASGEVDVYQDDYQIPDDEEYSSTWTSSSTEYRLGLGYEASKNLSFQLMAAYDDDDYRGEIVEAYALYSQITIHFE